MDIEGLGERLRDWEVPFAIVANLETGEVTRIGDSTRIEADDLVKTLFNDQETVIATGRSLEGQIIPRIWSQGDVSCFICKPNEITLVGLFCRDKRSPVEQYLWAQSLNARVLDTFS